MDRDQTRRRWNCKPVKPRLFPPGENQPSRNTMFAGDIRNFRTRRKTFFRDPRLFVLRPAAATFNSI
jgi:hypothetical protein